MSISYQFVKKIISPASGRIIFELKSSNENTDLPLTIVDNCVTIDNKISCQYFENHNVFYIPVLLETLKFDNIQKLKIITNHYNFIKKISGGEIYLFYNYYNITLESLGVDITGVNELELDIDFPLGNFDFKNVKIVTLKCNCDLSEIDLKHIEKLTILGNNTSILNNPLIKLFHQIDKFVFIKINYDDKILHLLTIIKEKNRELDMIKSRAGLLNSFELII